MGNLIGNINNIDIVESTIVSEMDPTTSGTKITATVRNVPTDIGEYFTKTINLITTFIWKENLFTLKDKSLFTLVI